MSILERCSPVADRISPKLVKVFLLFYETRISFDSKKHMTFFRHPWLLFNQLSLFFHNHRFKRNLSINTGYSTCLSLSGAFLMRPWLMLTWFIYRCQKKEIEGNLPNFSGEKLCWEEFLPPLEVKISITVRKKTKNIWSFWCIYDEKSVKFYSKNKKN